MKLLGLILMFIARAIYRSDVKDFCRLLTDVYNGERKRPIDGLPEHLVQCLIIAEDRRFYRHRGVDFFSFARAIWLFITRGQTIRGVSTIEQQLVRIITGRREPTVRRKWKEVLLASTVQDLLPKSEIPSFYLSVAYFGWRMNGIRDACKRKEWRISEISESQAASLIARLKYPEPRMPSHQRSALISMRADYILAQYNEQKRKRAK